VLPAFDTAGTAAERRRRSIGPPHAGAPPTRWPWLVRGFVRYGRRLVQKSFHGVRVLGDPTAMPADPPGPLLVCMNHPSWWDPMLALVAATHFFPGRRHFAPIDAEALQKYRVFTKLGFFGVEQHDARRGAASFLRTGGAILSHDDAALWVTGQGEFTDPRTRPIELRPGVAHLARRVPRATVLPMAVEYAFWNERYPEALLAFGEPIRVELHPDRSAGAWNLAIAHRLEAALDRLSDASQRRDPDAFTTVLDGSVGVGGLYDACRRAAAWLRGKTFDPSHGGRSNRR
jgi:1-acyl-sn-glycerol-3-phosphate acyltransferase